MSDEYGRRLRLARILGVKRRCLLAAIDDGYFSGPSGRLLNTGDFVTQLTELGIDGFLSYPGIIQNHIRPDLNVIRLANATVAGATRTPAVRLRGTPVRMLAAMGVDGIVVHASLGVKRVEVESISLAARLISEAHDFGLPVMTAIYYRGDTPGSEAELQAILQGARLGLELGSDLVKTTHPGTTERLETLLAACDPIPVFVAGGIRKSEDHTRALVDSALRAHTAGLVLGRSLVYSADLQAITRYVRELL